MNVDLVGTIVLIVLSLVSIAIKGMRMYGREECAGHCGQTHRTKDMEFIGGGYFCEPCMDDLQSRPFTEQDEQMIAEYTEYHRKLEG